MTPLLPPVRERIADRSFPSIHQAWDNVVGLDHLTSNQHYARHDLHWSPSFGLDWQKTATAPTYGLATSPPDGINNRRWMRLFTTMSLTHSDGYVLYNFNENMFRHLWYPFWDAAFGQPVGPKAQLYKYIEGLFIREFTNGWAVYNRSGQAKLITLPAPVTRASDSGDNPAAMTHLLPDLDGEICLKTKRLTDVNGDAR